MSKDYYKNLGLNRNASKDDIKRAYRDLAQQHHPDKKGGDEKKFKEINEAYQILSDDQKRQQYDQFGTAFEGFSAQGGPASGWQGVNWEDVLRGFSGAGQRVNFEDFDFSDIFGDIFSRAGFSAQGGPRPFGGQAASGWGKIKKGKDIVVDMEISLEDAYKGIEKEIKLKKLTNCPHCKGVGGELGSGKKKCPNCYGSGQIEQTKRTFFGVFSQVSTCPKCNGKGEIPEKECKKCRGTGRIYNIEEIKVDLPAGVNDGQTIRMAGKGEMPKKQGIPGDLYIRVHLKKHKNFERKGDDIYYNAELKFTQAVLGDKIEVPTLDGKLRLKIPQGTESGKLFRLANKGIPSLNGSGRGDQYVRIRVKVPKRLSRKGKELVEKLKEEGV